MINPFSFLAKGLWRQILWVAIGVAFPLSFIGGMMLQRQLSKEDLIKVERVGSEYHQLQSEYEELQRSRKALEQDRDNVLLQSKRFISEANRLSEIEQQYNELSKSHETLAEAHALMTQNFEDLQKGHDDLQIQLGLAQDTAEELEAVVQNQDQQIRSLQEEIRQQQKVLREGVARDPGVIQLRKDFEQIQSENKRLLKKQKGQDKITGKLEKKLGEMEKYKQRLKEAKSEIEALEKDQRELLKELEATPRKFKDLAQQNKILIKETADMHYNLGVFYSENKRFDRAVSEFKKVVDLNPQHSKAHYNLGFIYSEHYQNHELAQEHFKKYLWNAPGDDSADWVRNYLLTRESYDGTVLKS